MILFKFPVIETNCFRLRELTLDDTENVFHYFADEEVVQYYGLEPFSRLEQAKQFIMQINKNAKVGTMIRWAIADKNTNELIGTVGFQNWSRSHHRAEIAYDLRKEEWGKGIMTEVVATIIPLAFNILGLNRIGATVRQENKRSRSLLHKFGFVEEGVLKEYQYYRGEYYNLLIYGLVRNVYEKKTGL